MRAFTLVFSALIWATAQAAMGATISGTVTDPDGKPIKDARVDHTGKRIFIDPRWDVAPSSKDEIRTDADGHFEVTTTVPAVVVRKPGYKSQRILITGDATVQVTLRRMKPESHCGPSPPPVTLREANDVDYQETNFIIETKAGPQGVSSGRGPNYSWGAPSDGNVWTSTEYDELVHGDGVIDAWGHSADGKYWHSRTRFAAAAFYYNVDRETAQLLDCVMDRSDAPR